MFTGMEGKRKDSIHPLNNTLKYFDTYNEENWRKEEKRNWCTITYCTNIVHECKRIILIEDISLSRELTVDRDVPFFASLSLFVARSLFQLVPSLFSSNGKTSRCSLLSEATGLSVRRLVIVWIPIANSSRTPCRLSVERANSRLELAVFYLLRGKDRETGLGSINISWFYSC